MPLIGRLIFVGLLIRTYFVRGHIKKNSKFYAVINLILALIYVVRW
jgi:hypothetical protein